MGKIAECEAMTADQLGQLILNNHVKVKEFESLLAEHCCELSYFTYPPIKRGSTQKAPQNIVSVHKNGTEAKELISGLYDYEEKLDGITVPTKRVGVLSVCDGKFSLIYDMANEINSIKAVIKKQAPILIPNRSERRRFFNNYAPDAITSTIYRKIPLLEGVRSVSYYWCDSQFTMLESSYDEAIRQVSLGEHKEHEKVINKDHRLEKVKTKLKYFSNLGYSFHRYMSLRVHPVQQVYCAIGKKTSLKVSCPLIIPHSSALELGCAEIKDFCDENLENQFPDKVGKHIHCGFGFYASVL